MSQRWLIAVLATACFGIGMGNADAQVSANCPDTAQDLPVQSLYGTWEATIEGQPGIATMQLGKHPEYEGVRGTITRAGKPPAQLAGDIDNDGLIAMDESQDGQSISATWSGALEPTSCGKEFKGTWRNASDDSAHNFVLHKVGKWQ